MIRYIIHMTGAAWLFLSPHLAFGNDIEETNIADGMQCLNACNVEFAKDSGECSALYSSLTCDERADAMLNECEAICRQDHQQITEVEY